MLSFHKGWPLYIALLLELWALAICLSILWEYYKPYSEKKQRNAKNNQCPCEADNTTGGNLGKLRRQNKKLRLFFGNIGQRVKENINLIPIVMRIGIDVSNFFTKLFNFCLKFFRIVHDFIYSQRKN